MLEGWLRKLVSAKVDQLGILKYVELFYKQQDINRRQNPQYNQQYQSSAEAEAYFKRLQEYDLIELNEAKQLLRSYIQISSVHNAPSTTTFLGSSELDSRFTPKSLTTFGGLYKTVMYQLTPSIVTYFSTGNHLFIPIMNKGSYLGENPAFYHDERLVAAICSHENYAILYLTDEEFKHFQTLNVPYALDY